MQTAKKRTERRAPTRLALWNVGELKNGPDPMGRGVALTLEKGVSTVLFLAIVAPPPGSPVPHFVASAGIGDQEKLRLWTGLKWDPTVVPELWNLFVRTGLVELGPPGAATNIKSNRNVVRSAFGASSSEWLVLVRAGPADNCRGVLALTASRSILTELGSVMPLITSPAPVVTKKAS